MTLKVRVIPKASRNLVKEENGSLKVYTTSPAQDGLANARVIKLLSDHFKVKKYQIKIVQGNAYRNKLIEIDV